MWGEGVDDMNFDQRVATSLVAVAERMSGDRLRLSACCGLRRAQAQAVLRRILYWMAILRDFPETYMGYTSHNKNGVI